MATDTDPAALLASSISDLLEDIASTEAGIAALELSIPEYGSLEFRLHSNREAIAGTNVQIRMDQEYLAQQRGDLRRMERTQRARARAA